MGSTHRCWTTPPKHRTIPFEASISQTKLGACLSGVELSGRGILSKSDSPGVITGNLPETRLCRHFGNVPRVLPAQPASDL